MERVSPMPHDSVRVPRAEGTSREVGRDAVGLGKANIGENPQCSGKRLTGDEARDQDPVLHEKLDYEKVAHFRETGFK
ncbi:MAG: hypothetical protein ACOCZB_06680 [Spirochaetota bacterium]